MLHIASLSTSKALNLGLEFPANLRMTKDPQDIVGLPINKPEPKELELSLKIHVPISYILLATPLNLLVAKSMLHITLHPFKNLHSPRRPSRALEGTLLTHRLLSSSFLGLPYRILNISHNKELLRSPGVGMLTPQDFAGREQVHIYVCHGPPARVGLRRRSCNMGLGFSGGWFSKLGSPLGLLKGIYKGFYKGTLWVVLL